MKMFPPLWLLHKAEDLLGTEAPQSKLCHVILVRPIPTGIPFDATAQN
jgi:hypothetical protein